MQYEWDEAKRLRNLEKHDVDFALWLFWKMNEPYHAMTNGQ